MVSKPQATPTSSTPQANAPQPTPGASVVLPATALAQVASSTPVRTRTNRQTGTRINLWAPLPNGPNGGGTGTWVVQCQQHNQHTNHHTTRKAAKATVYMPQMWCSGCAAVVAAKQAQPQVQGVGGSTSAPGQPLPAAAPATA